MAKVEQLFGEKPRVYQWNAPATASRKVDNSSSARSEAAQGLADLVNSHDFAVGERLNLVGHSHGGNISIEAINLGLKVPVTNLVTLGTPVRDDYQLSGVTSVAKHVQLYTPNDEVQTSGGGFFFVSGIGEFGQAGRTFVGAINVQVDAASHSDLHSPDVIESARQWICP